MMSSSTQPPHPAAQRAPEIAVQRAPPRESRDGPFAQLLQESLNPTTSAAAFDQTGVFGRRASEPDGVVPAKLSATEAPQGLEDAPSAPAPTRSSPSNTATTPDRSQVARASRLAAPAPALTPGNRQSMTEDNVAAPPLVDSAITKSDIESACVDQSSTADRLAASSARSLAARAANSALVVAIHATDHGLRVFARVGRMPATERERLRHAVQTLLREHGLHGAEIILEGAAT